MATSEATNTVPEAPANVSVQALGKSAVVSWAAGGDGGSAITQYTVTYSTEGEAPEEASVTVNGPATSVTVGELKNGRSYTFTVAATNAAGTGPSSNKSKPVSLGFRRRRDDPRRVRGWLAVGFLVLAVGAEVKRDYSRWVNPPSDHGYWLTVVLLVLALICAILWVPAGFPARGRPVPAMSVRRRGAYQRGVIVGGAVAAVLIVTWVYAVSGPAHHWFLWFAGRRNFVWTPAWSALGSAFIVATGLLFAHGLARIFSTAEHPDDFTPDPNKPETEDEQRRENAIAFRTAGLKGAVVGADGIASTSRLMPALWTVALLFGVVLLLLVGRTPHCPKPLMPNFVNPSGVGGSCPGGALTLGTVSFADQLGKNFPWDYLLLLGFPVGAALTAKWQAITFGDRLRAPAATAGKASTPDPQNIGVGAGLSQVISNDAGQGSLANSQYLAFTLVTIGFFLLQVITHPRGGLPEIPTALLVLSGVAVGGYVANRQIVGRTTPQGDS